MSGVDRTIRWSTAAAVIGVAAVAAVVSYEHAYALVRVHGEAGWTGRLIPLMIIRGSQSESSEVPAVADTSGVAPRVNPLHARAAEEFADEVAAGRTPSIHAIRARLHVGQPRAHLTTVT